MPVPDTSSVTTLVDERDDAPAETLPVGFVVGAKYVIKRVLGAGGNGAVYEGEHTAVGHRVAIKVVHRALTHREETMARFEREARICGSLRHPHVGQVYDVGVLDDGSPYMVMELQEGRSLGDVLDETRLPIAAIIDITRQLLAGLGAAHRSGTIHRDVKPDNVMIVRDHSGEAVVKLVDFGISKSIDKQQRGVTEDGIIIGSPDYMPPEQLRGEAVDVRTDLYAVGVLLYEAITNRTPFDADNVTDLIVAVLRDPVTRPRALREDCPEDLERIVLKAISRDPAKRFQSADDMSRALAEVRGAGRITQSTNLARLSERPPRKVDTGHKHRKRTIDSRTLEGIRVQTGGFPPAHRLSTARIAAIAGAVLLLGGLGGWFANKSGDSGGAVIATQLTSSPSRPIAAPSAPAPKPPVSAVATPQPAPPAPAAAPAVPPSATSMNAEAAAAPSVEPQKPQRARAPQPAPSRVSTAQAVVDPAVVQDLLKQAATAFARGQTEQARGLYQQVIRMNSREADAWRGLGVTASQLGAKADASRAFQRYLQLRPTAADAARVRAQLEKLQ